MIISFIIPVYNAENEIQNTLQSIMNQHLSEDDYEIILVNDGSTDNSQELLERLAVTHKGLKLIQQENRGPGAARNTALKIAKGDFIFFVDADDYLLPNTLSSLLQYICKNDTAELILFDAFQDNNGKLSNYITRPKKIQNEITGAYYLSNYRVSGTIWSAIFSRNFIEKYNILMPEVIFNEDEAFMAEVLLYATKVKFYHFPIYVYFRREGSITNPDSIEKEKRLISDFRTVINRVLAISQRKDLSEVQKLGIESKLNWFSVDLLIQLSRIPFEYPFHEEVLDEMIKNKMFPLSSINPSWKYRAFRFFFKNRKRALLLFKLGIRF